MPASGKTTQADLIAKDYKFVQFGMGDYLRAEIKSESLLGEKIRPYVEQGALIPNDLMGEVIKKVKFNPEDNGIIFDGFPRMVEQADMLGRVMEDMNLQMLGFFYLKIDQETAIARITERADIEHRQDDKDPAVIENRINIFLRESVPLLQYYRKKNKLIELAGEQSIEQIYAEIKKHL